MSLREVQMSTVHLTAAEASGEVALSYGMPSATTQHRLPAGYSPLAHFFAPRNPAPSPSARRAAPSRSGHGPSGVLRG